MRLVEDHSHPFVASRRHVLQGCAVVVGAGLLGLHGDGSALADDPGAGGDGAPPPPGTPNISPLAGPSGGTSYNGWPVGSPGSVIGVQNFVQSVWDEPVGSRAARSGPFRLARRPRLYFRLCSNLNVIFEPTERNVS